jgi:hypothetical protein
MHTWRRNHALVRRPCRAGSENTLLELCSHACVTCQCIHVSSDRRILEVGIESSDYHAIDVNLTWIIVDYHIIQDC